MIFFELSQQIYRFRVKSDFSRYDNRVIVSSYRFRVIVTVKSGLSPSPSTEATELFFYTADLTFF